uniref:Cytochrome c oxidase subunit 3 n=1 Tax=Craspedacusta sowerbii TaxID=128124 RepID=A0A0S4LYX9_CRASO|nr:cytochrome c oxidase subunit III [Craspedacusta sowerbii]QXT43899.1 cytochrome c oxidase subunit III [Craspedacusta sowerbii]QZN07979.1 cytochrome c oxidase subunit III [Craspedacusta sowerbii]QZN08009.1 cytochrome c oxidase subunit III [Craspedacusta sowerbii]QZN08024.1 cytochrome c oxidase subunit III [Craspedacusta sowerbii]
MSHTYHPYHLVDPSPWPYVTGCGAMFTTVGAILYFHYSQPWLLLLGVAVLVFIFFVWCRDVIREATFQGHHTFIVKRGLKIGMILFILSEICFFFSFFWAFFHSSLVPAIELGSIWPPQGIEVLNPFSVPLLNTAVLLSSGATVTWAHHAIISGKRDEAIQGLFLTLVLGVLFTSLQVMEYIEASFCIADSVYGSVFFVATGFHGLHVIIGTTFLAVCWVRLVYHQFTRHHHFGFEAASWYWHFVDVVWLFLYVCIYWWGS